MVFYKCHSHFQYRNSILLVKDIFHTGREGSAPRWLSSNVEYICCRYSAGVILQPMFLTNGQWIRYSGDFPRSQLKTVSILVSGVHPWHAFQIICSYSRTVLNKDCEDPSPNWPLCQRRSSLFGVMGSACFRDTPMPLECSCFIRASNVFWKPKKRSSDRKFMSVIPISLCLNIPHIM